jgi:7-cyano-7-deazaguanine synthase in queuosine biosynthesis
MNAYGYDFSVPSITGQGCWLDGFRIKDRGAQNVLLHNFRHLEQDLLDVAMAVYVADRISHRSPGRSGEWVSRMSGRSFQIVIPVREIKTWQNPAVQKTLKAALEFLTTDEWNIRFVARTKHTIQEVPLFKREFERPFVGLFSGGLDSFAGAILQVLEDQFKDGVLVSAYSNSNLVSRQRELVQQINTKLKPTGKSFTDLHLWHNLERDVKHDPSQPLPVFNNPKGFKDEVTQRSRGFLFLSLGLVITRALGLNVLNVYENGVGAINLPYTAAGLGVDYTRAMNPELLRRVAVFASELFGMRIQIENPSLWKTKGQMCAGIEEYGFGKLAVQTISCDGFPRHKFKHEEQCGRCTSCLLRRISLAATSGLELLDRENSRYQRDVYHLASNKENAETLFPLHAMQHQALNLKAAVSHDAARDLFLAYPELLRVRAAIAEVEGSDLEHVTKKLVGLYRSYVREWEWFNGLRSLPSHLPPAA